MRIYADSEICLKTGPVRTEAVKRAVQNLRRDMHKCTEPADSKEVQESGSGIWLVAAECEQEGFRICDKEGHLEIGAADSLGFVFGIYTVSREILGIQNFWFWNDQVVEKKKYIEVPENIRISSKPYAVRYRGWFLNDEVLLHTWKVDQKKEKPWEMALEALLRCGGNLVIPGTGKNADEYGSLASAMGLYITHHHAQPLGAKMFVQAYPQLSPSYDEHAEEFHKLWREGIDKQKDMNVIWSLGFRGQGDYPFWVNDPRYQTPEAQGRLMSRLLKKQYDMIRQELPDAVCCTNLYGEAMELYQQGFLEMPDDVIKIWADNGFGKMVTRRQENHNPRIPALPCREETGKHGIYYHVSFYDLQAANHVTMLPNEPEFISRELKKVQELDMTEYWLVNCSNVKPHVYFLDLIAKIWQQGDVDIELHRSEYVNTYYGKEGSVQIEDCLRDYPRHALQYGPNEDDHAGEQFSNHVPRILISQYMRDKNIRAEDLRWATSEETLQGQIRWYRQLCETAAESYTEYLLRCEQTDLKIAAHHRERKGVRTAEVLNSTQTLFRDSILLQAKLHYHCFLGARMVCDSLLEGVEGQYQQAFYHAGCAREEYLKADHAMREREHGKWKGYYANECLTDVKQTAWVLEGLMSYLRNLGDGPHYYQWQRDFLYTEDDRKVMLIMNMENHLKDNELFELMKQKMEA